MRRLILLFAMLALVLAAQIPAGAVVESEVPRTTASFDDDVHKVAYAGDVLYAGGRFTSAVDVDGTRAARHHLAAVDSSSGELLPFAPVLDGQVLDLVATSEHLYVAGDFRHVGDVPVPRLARFDLATGELDEAWRPSPSSTVFAVEPAGDRVYLGGRFATVGGHAQPYLAAVSASDGAPVTSFAPRVQEGAVRDIASGHGRLYASGGFGSVEDEKQFGKLAAFDPESGAVDRSFQASVYVLTRQVVVDGDRLYAALDGRGGEVRAFDTSGEALWYQAADGGMQAVTVWGDTIIGGGHFDKACDTNHAGPNGECVDGVKAPRGKLLAVDENGKLLPWNPNANGIIGVWDLKVHPSGTGLAVAGAFTTFGGGSMEQRHLALFE
ncbi:PQQ-binding-like beta-propeller repeat protein [Glycomyces tenuis]|uniref:PQQ-binding-like beta-propeller repeat protein n=1 Tax=Glycomyces tenuis TaxID=58116 RepID=UPI00138B0E2C|nr:PQQ-binding-like beta-propeller repeat protein [Glycomyces tenuis]